MIELIFVIVVLGILAGVAIPRLAASRDDAVLVKGKSQVSAIRSGIATVRSQRLMQGLTPFPPPYLEGNQTVDSDTNLFSSATDDAGNTYNILEYPIRAGNTDGRWSKESDNTDPTIDYDFHIDGGAVTFTYNPTNGTFTCPAGGVCDDLTQ